MKHGVHGQSCCVPARTSTDSPAVRATTDVRGAEGAHRVEQCAIPAGTFRMGDLQGDGYYSDGERPVHEVTLAGFSMDAVTVTVADFARFVDETGYQTDADRFGWSSVFAGAFEGSRQDVMGTAPGTPWWLCVRGANWRHPGGAGTDALSTTDHPVTHVSWNDASAYCEWAGRRLPTEAEWEYACRGGIDGARFPWGDELQPDGQWLCNIWQGQFPDVNTRDDGYRTTAPVRSYRRNGFGLWQTVGNVWEWCADWFSASYYGLSPGVDPKGPEKGHAKVMRGGSYLCHESYCNRYRNAARSRNTPDSSTGHCGFRTVAING
ncbi:formylglycine-generating enzyme family protein [Burkholderia anthina]|uniref:formylglycine-generating enzyme family protein n=1 Tax=Burkholderia anthina TaxID=179879 RepID=UPI00158D5B63|nr:formylglycine-generating enzyme family protein [Burkholderia anthina]